MRKLKLYWKIVIILAVLSVVFNIAACFRGFCDLYTEKIYMKITDITGWLFGLIPIAAGEILMYAGGIIVIAAAVILILLIFLRKKSGYRKFTAGYMKSVLMILVCFVFIYTVNWIIPLRTTPLSPGTEEKRVYTIDDLRSLRNYMVENLNSLCEEVPRDETGRLIIPDNMNEKIIRAMKNAKDELPLLDGYYPPPKPALCSAVLDWMGIGGFTYPYTKEIQYNKYDSRLNFPALIAHEYSHYRGYFRENEGEFVEFIALNSSDDPVLKYSGFISAYYYIQDSFWDNLLAINDHDTKKTLHYYLQNEPQVNDQVWQDRDDSISEANELYEEEVSDFAESTFSPVAEQAADTGWETQKQILQEASYDGVTELLLQYFDGKLY